MRAVGWIVGAGLLMGGFAHPSDVPEFGAPVSAVWHEQRVNFVYAGRTSRYSCDSLEAKLRALLLELGARFAPKVRSLTCEPSGTSLELSFLSPALPSAEAGVARPGDEPVEARFERFTLTNDQFRNFGSADCELVEEFVRQVLPKFATRRVRSDIDCAAYRDQKNGSRYLVRGEILRVLPPGERHREGILRER